MNNTNKFDPEMVSPDDQEQREERMIRIPVNLTAGIAAVLFSAFIFIVMPVQVIVSEKDVVDGRAFPTLLMAVMLLCGAALIVKDLYKILRKEPLEWKTINVHTELKALVLFGILFVTYLLAKLTDLFAIGAVFCCVSFLLYFKCRKKSYYVITLVVAVAIWAVFRFVLNVDF